MDEEEIEVFSQCIAVLKFISQKLKISLKIKQMQSTAEDMILSQEERPLYRGTLKDCDMVIAGMYLLTKLINEKTE